MSLVLNTNIAALNAANSLNLANTQVSSAMEQLSTGSRINSAADDAAGLAISNRMTSQINGYSVAIRNANDGVSLAQTADGAMTQITTMLQRMRDLAVQSATGTMTSSDRANSQLEVSQLQTQIQQIASQTNLNGVQLLDGSAGHVTLQIGTNAGDTMTMGFNSLQTKDLGIGSQASLSSMGGRYSGASSTAFNAFEDGSLLVNGVNVGASLATSDQLSSTDQSASAIAKAAAINAVSAQSGVFATVGATVIAGSNGMSSNAPTAGQTAILQINGVTTSEIAFTGNSQLDLAAVALAINNISGQTGVTANNSNDTSQGISLTAADGRNIDLAAASSSATTDLTQLGLSQSGVYVGSYALSTHDGSAITIGAAASQAVNGPPTTGLTSGVYQANTANMVTNTRATTGATATPTSGDAGLLNGDTLVINNVNIQAANGNDDTASSGDLSQKASSAIAIAAAINKSSAQTGVSATAQANVIAGDGFTAGQVTAVTLNGVSITTNLDSTSTIQNVLDELNAYTGQTGVVASSNGAGVVLTAADGRNISIEVDGSGGASALGLADTTVSSTATTYYGQVALSSSQSFTVNSGSEGANDNFTALGFSQGTFGATTPGLKVSQIDISSQQGASQAINAIDAAINTVSSNQALSGAYQNRLNYVVNNLTSENTNLSSARSNITDADYGAAASALAKSQIIQQAATAMLAQANQSQQLVLSLLR